MFRNYFKIAIRNLQKHKGYSAINIFGLAIGIACCLLIFLYVKDELTYDRYQSQGEHIYRINSEIDWFGEKSTMGATSALEAKEYANRIPEIEAFTRYKGVSLVVKKGEDYVNQYQAIFTDAGTFDIFDYQVLSGSLEGALDNLNSVVISESVALKYFDKVDVSGQELSIKMEGKMEQYVVEAVFKDFPANSSLNSKIYFPWAKSAVISRINPVRAWSNIGYSSFLLLKEGVEPAVVEAKMKEVRALLNPGEDGEWVRNITNLLQPLTDIHLNTEIDGNSGIKNTSSPTFSYILGGIGGLILLLACINFANLSVARSIPRAKEIGLRKVLGAQRKQVAWQFLGEAFLVSSIAFVLGLIMAEFFLPTFGQLTNKEFSGGIWKDANLLLACFIIVCLSALLAGAYPAFFASRFSILNSLSGKVQLNGKQYLTKGLVLFQFTIAAVLVIGTVVMNQQINFLLNTDMGYDDKNLVVMNLSGNNEQANVIKAELEKNPNLLDISLSDGFSSATSMGYNGEEFFCVYAQIDSAYLNTIGLRLIEGRNLKEMSDDYQRTNDTLRNILVSKEFLAKIKFEGDPLGLVINDGGGEDTSDAYRIVGVLDDFIFSTAARGIAPIALYAGRAEQGEFDQINIRYKEGYTSEVETVLEEAWRKVDPYTPLNFSFQEESNMNHYAEEKRWKSIITSASIIAIIVSCLGLFGMAHLSTQQKQKEIGVRKVLGANVRELVFMLNITFTKLVLVSAILAIPMSYYLMEDWLSNFAFRIDLGFVVFAIPTAITLMIAWLTVSAQSIRSANANPVDSLRSE